jgi:predicted DNA-binding protein YlxM (UPF0122 family)
MKIFDVYTAKHDKMHIDRFLEYKNGNLSIGEMAKAKGMHYQSIRKSIAKGLKLYEAQTTKTEGKRAGVSRP